VGWTAASDGAGHLSTLPRGRICRDFDFLRRRWCEHDRPSGSCTQGQPTNSVLQRTPWVYGLRRHANALADRLPTCWIRDPTGSRHFDHGVVRRRTGAAHGRTNMKHSLHRGDLTKRVPKTSLTARPRADLNPTARLAILLCRSGLSAKHTFVLERLLRGMAPLPLGVRQRRPVAYRCRLRGPCDPELQVEPVRLRIFLVMWQDPVVRSWLEQIRVRMRSPA
jgi:hypothetical protein